MAFPPTAPTLPIQPGVGKGRVQLETSLQWDRLRNDDSMTAPCTRRPCCASALGESSELRIETDGRTVVHARDPASGAHTIAAGYADTAIGVKWHWSRTDRACASPRWACCCMPTCRAAAANCAAMACGLRCAWPPNGTCRRT